MDNQEFINDLRIITKDIPKEQAQITSHKKVVFSDKVINKMVRKAKRIDVCEHCGLRSNLSNIKRYHGKNCKLKGGKGGTEITELGGKKVSLRQRTKLLREYIQKTSGNKYK